MSRRVFAVTVALAFLAFVAVPGVGLCVLVATRWAPREGQGTVIVSPASNSTYRAGEFVTIDSMSTLSGGIVRVDIVVDGAVVRSVVPPAPVPVLAVNHAWPATQGTHTITVRSYGASNQGGAATIYVIGLPRPTATAMPASAPTGTPVAVATASVAPSSMTTPTREDTPGSATVCTNQGAFVADVTVPDGTVMAAGQAFTKVWRVANSGTCTWGEGYAIVYGGGYPMAPAPIHPIPYTPPGTSVDLAVPMAAPQVAGSHAGSWRLRTPEGSYMSVVLNVSVNVVVPPSPTQMLMVMPSAIPLPTSTAPLGSTGTPTP